MNRLRVTLVVAVAVAALLGGASSQAAGGGLPTCGPRPVSTGPAAELATITLAGPGEARSGSTIRPVVTIRVTGADAPTALGEPAFVVIVRDGKVVGRYLGAVAGAGLAIRAEARSARGQAVETAPLLLSGCPVGEMDFVRPDATRQPLPAGEYQLIASMDGFEYGQPLSVLATAPISIRIT